MLSAQTDPAVSPFDSTGSIGETTGSPERQRKIIHVDMDAFRNHQLWDHRGHTGTSAPCAIERHDLRDLLKETEAADLLDPNRCWPISAAPPIASPSPTAGSEMIMPTSVGVSF
jgi:hypothetical protein